MIACIKVIALFLIYLQIALAEKPDPISNRNPFFKDAEAHRARCRYMVLERGRNYVDCLNVGIDGKSVDQLLREITKESLENINGIDLNTAGNVVIDGNDLPIFKNLTFLGIREQPTYNPCRNCSIIIKPIVFEKMPQLNRINVHGISIENSTFAAMNGLKEKLTDLSLHTFSPFEGNYDFIKGCTNLTGLHVACYGYSDVIDLPSTFFEKSASKLKSLVVQHCPILNLESKTLRGMRNLEFLSLISNNMTSIEEGTFDDLVKLKTLYLVNNKIRTLPDGLFDKMNQLETVEFTSRTVIENVSNQNFTHCLSLKKFYNGPNPWEKKP